MGSMDGGERRYEVVEVSDGCPRYALIDRGGDVVEPVTQYLLELLASRLQPGDDQVVRLRASGLVSLSRPSGRVLGQG